MPLALLARGRLIFAGFLIPKPLIGLSVAQRTDNEGNLHNFSVNAVCSSECLIALGEL
jgi:hypothetical protein